MIYDWLSWNSEIFEVSIEMSLHLNIVFIDEVEGIKRRITDEAGGRVCNTTLDPDTEAINDI